MAKFLVTGASGFIGAHVARALVAQGHDVTCLLRPKSQLDRLGNLEFRPVEGDLRDTESLVRAVAGQEAVFHLAAVVRTAGARQLHHINCEGTANLARACAAATTPPRLLLVSSMAAMGPSAPDRPRVESDPPAPVSNYGRSKLAGERAARQWAKAMPITIVRPPVVFGEADEGAFEIFFPIARWGIHFLPTWQTHRVSLVHAADLAQAIVLAAARGEGVACDSDDGAVAARGCYFVAAERDVTFAELGRMMGTALGRARTLIVAAGPLAVWSAALLATVAGKLARRPPYFGLDKAREARAGSWTCSAAAAQRDLGFRVAKPLEARLQDTVNWYREHGWL